MKKYNSTKLMREFNAAGMAIRFCSADGRLEWEDNRAPTANELITAERIKAAHDPEEVAETDIAKMTLDELKTVVKQLADSVSISTDGVIK